MLCFVFAYIKKRKFINKRNTIIENGIKLPGTIIDTITVYDIDRSMNERDNSQRYYYFVVEYNYKGQTKKFNTPYISFSPSNLLSKDVDVYIYNDEIYVDNLKFKNTKRVIPLK